MVTEGRRQLMRATIAARSRWPRGAERAAWRISARQDQRRSGARDQLRSAGRVHERRESSYSCAHGQRAVFATSSSRRLTHGAARCRETMPRVLVSDRQGLDRLPEGPAFGKPNGFCDQLLPEGVRFDRMGNRSQSWIEPSSRTAVLRLGAYRSYEA